MKKIETMLIEIADLLENEDYVRLDVRGFSLQYESSLHRFPSIEAIYGYLLGRKGFLPNMQKYKP